MYVESFDRNTSAVHQTPAFRHCKFFNLLNVPVAIYWEDTQKSLVKILRPLSTAGITASIGNVFVFQFGSVVLERFQIRDTGSHLFSIDPLMIPKMMEHYGWGNFTSTELESYTWLTKTLAFNDYYYKFTGRSYLSRYGKLPPKHHMWPAHFVGEQHVVSTNETHFRDDSLPELDILQHADLVDHRSPHNITLTVLAPRVFEIRDFLSVPEVQHILQLAQQKQLTKSQIGQGAGIASKGTRSSQNSWIWPDESPIVQSIYRRVYDLLQLDDNNNNNNITEPMQIVRYRVSEAYKAHTDFGYPDPSHPLQPTRFATVLLYLNNVPAGGETSFPLWSNLKVAPEMGKAVLFYSQVRTAMELLLKRKNKKPHWRYHTDHGWEYGRNVVA